MTIDEAKIKIGELACYARTKGWDEEYTEAVNMTIKALEQEQCEDCIRRSDIGLTDFEIVMCNGDYKEGLKMLLDKIEKAPSVTPMPKMGRWINIVDNRGEVITSRCSRCERSPIYAIKSDYCPNCGAKMQEVQNETNN